MSRYRRVRPGEYMIEDDIYREDGFHPARLGVVDPRYTKSRILRFSSNSLENAHEKAFDIADFQAWRCNGRKRLLWVRGEPGLGKTTAMCRLINELQNAPESPSFKSFYFCQSTDCDTMSDEAVLRGLIYLLYQQQPSLLDHIRKRHKRISRNRIGSGDAWLPLAGTFFDILNSPTLKARGVFFAIDALDEGVSGLQNMLDLIERTASTCPHVKWVISSGQSVEIEGLVKKLGDGVAAVLHSNSPTETLYPGSLQRIEESDQRETCKRLLAIMVIIYSPINTHEIGALLETSPISGDQSFLDRIMQLCAAFLVIDRNTLYFTHPAAKSFLLLELKTSDSDLLEVTKKTALLRSLDTMMKSLRRDMYSLQRPGTMVDQILQPKPDPLADIRYAAIFWIHHLLEWCHGPVPAFSDDEKVLSEGGLLETFLKEKYLNWLEALSLLGRVPDGMRAMAKLKDFVEPGSSTFLKALVRDAYQFLVSNATVIEKAPLQVYASALVFWPDSSLIKQLYKTELQVKVTTNAGNIVTENEAAAAQESHIGPVWSVVFSPTDNHVLASASDDKTVKIWNTTNRQCLQTLKGHTDLIWSINFSADGNKIASASDDESVRIWQVDTGKCIKTLDGRGAGAYSKAFKLTGHSRNVWTVIFSHNGEQIATCASDNTAKIWDAATGECVQTFKGHKFSVFSIAMHQNKQLATGSPDECLRIWDIETGECLHIIKNESTIYTVAYSHSGRYVAAAGVDVRVYDTAQGTTVRTFANGGTSTNATAFSHDDRLIATVTDSSTVSIWNFATGQCVQKCKGHITSVYSVAFPRRHNELVASGSDKGEARIWNIATGTCLHVLDQGGGPIWAMSFMRGTGCSDQQIMTSSDAGMVKIWNVSTGACIYELIAHRHRDNLNFASFSHNGQQLATSADDGEVMVWNVVYGGSVWSMSFSRDGRWLATCSRDGPVRIWDQAKGDPRYVSCPHTDAIYSTCFSNNCCMLAAASEDRTISISAIDGGYLHRYRGHNGSVWAVAFSPDDDRIISTSSDRTLRLWDVEEETCIHVIEVGTSLSTLSFSDTGHHALTEIGHIELDSRPKDSSAVLGAVVDKCNEVIEFHDTEEPTTNQAVTKLPEYGLSRDRSWVTRDGEYIILLPPNCRPLCSAITCQTICIGCRNGQVWFIDFTSDTQVRKE